MSTLARQFLRHTEKAVAMFELWMDKIDPTVRLVTRRGSALPADLGPRDWKCIGTLEPDAGVIGEVDRLGFHFFHSDDPVPDPESLKNSNASGQ